MKKSIKVALIILSVIVIAMAAAFIRMASSANNALSSMVYENVDMSQTKDGTYTGETDAGLVFAKVAVTIDNHAIKKIDIIEHRNGKGKKAETITNAIIAKNSYDVDAVSGATLSSETIKSAVSKALKESCK